MFITLYVGASELGLLGATVSSGDWLIDWHVYDTITVFDYCLCFDVINFILHANWNHNIDHNHDFYSNS